MDTTPNKERYIVHLTESEIRGIISDELSKALKKFSDTNINDNAPEFIRRDDIALMLKCTSQTVSDRVKYKRLPQPIKKVGKVHFWLRQEVEDFILRGDSIK